MENMDLQAGVPPAPGRTGEKRGLTAATLKTIAIAAMLIDHLAYVFLPDYWGFPALPLHMVGRITGPVMFFFVAEGYHYTRNANRYTLRMAIFAVVSYVPFIWAMQGSLPDASNWMSFNVIYTLLMGLLALRARHEVKNVVLRWVLIGLCLVAATFGDWSYLAVLYILVFDVFRGNFKHQALGYTVITLTQLLPVLAQLITALLQGVPLFALGAVGGYLLYYAAFFIPLGLLYFYRGERGRSLKWLFYAFYPAHLLLIALFRDYIMPLLQ